MSASPSAPTGAGSLYLVAVPIGDPDDLGARARSALERAALVACEDTRSARSLLRRLGLPAPRLVSYHDHNEQARTPWLIERLLAGDDVALLPEAGTPLVSDPGYRLVCAAIERGIAVRPLPGPSAVLAALVASGLATDRFTFVGFLPRQQARRLALFEALAARTETLVAFEAPHRAVESLADARRALGDRRAALACNLTKPDERFLRGSLAELAAELAALETVRGELTLVVAGAEEGPAVIDAALEATIAALLAQGLGPRAIRDALAPLGAAPRRLLYERAVALSAGAAASPRERAQPPARTGAAHDRRRQEP